ncbi:MAG TPA: response regulator transcription factor [Polyangia bacterium]
MDPTRLLVVDDDPLIRRTLRRTLKAYEIHQAETCEAALDYLADHASTIDLVLLDVRFPDSAMQGDAALEAIHTRWPHLGVVVMTGGAYDVPTAIRCTQLGALAFATKLTDTPGGLAAEVERALRIVAVQRQVEAQQAELRRLRAPERVVDPHAAAASLSATAGGGHGDEAIAARPAPPEGATLSAREIQVLTLIADGFKRTPIAGQLGIRECTVDTLLERVRCKTGLWTTADLTKLAIRMRLTKLGR